VVDRGKTVNPRRVDLRSLNRPYLGLVDDDSNYCFGEGGAGTYSDGKLYTRATKRGDVRDVLETLARHDAPIDILTDARPHIGSNLLPKVITGMRERLEACGVQFLFGTRVTGLVVDDDKVGGRRVRGVTVAATSTGEESRSGHDGELPADAVVMATGHSARDVYRFLHDAGVRLEAKAFALGVRIEHPQPLIDRIQYGAAAGHAKLAAASYNAGPGNSRKWVAVHGDPRTSGVDPIDWLELIPFGETRNYVQRVLENTQVYRARLAGKAVALRILPDLYAPAAPSMPALTAKAN
jgi:uncharacterized FAD-dependent dehydrogenase